MSNAIQTSQAATPSEVFVNTSNYLSESFSIFIWVMLFVVVLLITLLIFSKIEKYIPYKYSLSNNSFTLIFIGILSVCETYGVYYWLVY